MTGYQGTADRSMDLGRAMQMLKMSRKGYLVRQTENRKRQNRRGRNF